MPTDPDQGRKAIARRVAAQAAALNAEGAAAGILTDEGARRLILAALPAADLAAELDRRGAVNVASEATLARPTVAQL